MTRVNALLQGAAIVFWDFDGVIKDSVAVKTAAFDQLFQPYGDDVVKRVRQHHEAHGGLSRYEKMPTYLEWAGEQASLDQVQDYCEQFSRLVLQAVIDSPWVPGVREYLREYQARQRFVLTSATPHAELQRILDAVDLAVCFGAVYGAPMSKAEAIQRELEYSGCAPERALMVGDSESDLRAAEANNVAFLLRRTPLNRLVQDRHGGPSFESLIRE